MQDAKISIQKYISSCQTKIHAKLGAKCKVLEEKEMFNLKINDAKSLNAGKGSLCHNCHLRLGHTAQNCVIERCQNIHSCRQDKLHPADLAKHQQLEQSISKLEKEIGQLSSEMENHKALIEKAQIFFSKVAFGSGGTNVSQKWLSKLGGSSKACVRYTRLLQKNI